MLVSVLGNRTHHHDLPNIQEIKGGGKYDKGGGIRYRIVSGGKKEEIVGSASRETVKRTDDETGKERRSGHQVGDKGPDHMGGRSDGAAAVEKNPHLHENGLNTRGTRVLWGKRTRKKTGQLGGPRKKGTNEITTTQRERGGRKRRKGGNRNRPDPNDRIKERRQQRGGGDEGCRKSRKKGDSKRKRTVSQTETVPGGGDKNDETEGKKDGTGFHQETSHDCD